MVLVSELKFPATPDYVGVIRLMIGGIVSRMDFDTEEIEDIKVAISEACTNVVQYAYQGHNTEDPFIYLTIEQKPKSIDFTVADNGIGFDPKKPPQRELSDDDVHMGLGLVFMKNLMDKVKVCSKEGEGTLISMQKKVSAKKVSSKRG